MSCIDTFYSNITIQDFKDAFRLEFINIYKTKKPFDCYPKYSSEITYEIDIKVYDPETFYLYQSKQTNNLNNSLVDLNWWNELHSVLDEVVFVDEYIQLGFDYASNIISNLFYDQCDDLKKKCFLLLVAYYITTLKQQRTTGINSSLGTITSQSINSVSASYQIPQILTGSLWKSVLSKNIFGLRFVELYMQKPIKYFNSVSNENYYDIE